MQLQFLWKDSSSGGGGCPTLYAVDGGYVVQGVKLTDADRAQLRQLADNEDAVFVPANVLDRLRPGA
ncbi:lipid A biosynthesis lauroyl acyltransferase [Catellatospora aurea]|uniref:Lipid A biosynthesis lauroyl acyltransferase n=1 Tax=Catellatospora aurea TaxID=1337874 RepID=A0ABW2H784_9ACTN